MKNSIFTRAIPERVVTYLEITIIVLLALFPLFFTYPFRINIFLSWEGAYRMYLGQIPYKDFGLPMGYGYWVIPAVFFKIFGPYFSTLVKAQAFINIISGLSFRSIFKTFGVNPHLRLIGVFLFVISFSFFNFWPWYNHSVVVYEFFGLALLLRGLYSEGKRQYFYLTAGGLALFFSFFTKQDGGALAVLIGGGLVVLYSLLNKNYTKLLTYAGAIVLAVLVMAAPFFAHDIGYWFNLGQAPHYSRFDSFDIVKEVFGKSLFLKFYIFIVIALFYNKCRKDFKGVLQDKFEVLFFAFTMAILLQAAVLQVTSYTPLDGNIYFHSFAMVYILWSLKDVIKLNSLLEVSLVGLLVFFWWSGVYWKYTERIVKRVFKMERKVDNEKVISINTYKLEEDSTKLDKSKWKLSPYKAFDGVYMPEETITGIQKLLELPVVQEKGTQLKMFNMSELTPLAHEMGYELETGLPLWYHMNVGMFDRELDIFSKRIEEDYYDVVLFEIIPNLNNFYPYELQDKLKENYRRVDVFQAPRRRTTELIEVYVRK